MDDARANNDLGRCRIRRNRTRGTHGRVAIRRSDSADETDRTAQAPNVPAFNVTRNLRRAISLIDERLPALGAHLERSTRTGSECCYDPEPATALHWEVSI